MFVYMMIIFTGSSFKMQYAMGYVFIYCVFFVIYINIMRIIYKTIGKCIRLYRISQRGKANVKVKEEYKIDEPTKQVVYKANDETSIVPLTLYNPYQNLHNDVDIAILE